MKKDKNQFKNKSFHKYIISYFLFFIILTISAFVYATLIHNKIITNDQPTFKNVTFIMGIINFFILGLLMGLIAKKNGLLEGLIASLFIILIVLIINLFVKTQLNYMFFVKGISYILSSCIGGIIGVNISNKRCK